MLSLEPVGDPKGLAILWPRVRDSLRRALERNGCGFAPVELAVARGLALLWVVTDGKTCKGAVVTQVESTEKGRVCDIIAFAGKSELCLPLLETLENYAKSLDCKCLALRGSRAWLRLLPDAYRETAVLIERAL